MSREIRPSLHCIDRIQNQIGEDLLDLNQVDTKVGQSIDLPTNCNVPLLGVFMTKRTAPFTISETDTSVFSNGSA
jgi:hypothetical protein